MCGFLCIFRAFLVCVFCPVVSTFPCPVPPPFFTAFALPYLSFLCIRLLTHAYIFLVCLSSRYLFLFVVLSALPILRPWAFRFPLCVFSASLPPPSRCYSPFFPSPFPPLPPSFPRFPSPFLRSFPLLLLPSIKKFPLKSCMISSVKYMFYSIFLVYMRKFF